MSPAAQLFCDAVLTVIFTIEGGVRCFAAIAAKQARSMLGSLFFYIDIVAIVPFYIGIIVAPLDFAEDSTWVVGGNGEDSGNTILKLLNLLRIIRIFKVTRLYPGAALLSRALIASAPALLVPLAFLILGAAFFGAVYFFFEGLDKENTSLLPEHDVGDALWFMIVTFTTVGYGDMYPVSKLGKIVTVLAILCGVIFMAMPITIVGNNFTLAIEEKEKLAVVLSIQQHLIDRHMRADNILELFNEIDTSGDGNIDYKEFKFFVIKLMRGSHVCLKPSSMRRLFAVFDEDGSGCVTCQEFCHLIFPDVDIDTWDEHEGDAETFAAMVNKESGNKAPTFTEQRMNSLLNMGEKLTGLDLDGDGDVNDGKVDPPPSPTKLDKVGTSLRQLLNYLPTINDQLLALALPLVRVRVTVRVRVRVRVRVSNYLPTINDQLLALALPLPHPPPQPH